MVIALKSIRKEFFPFKRVERAGKEVYIIANDWKVHSTIEETKATMKISYKKLWHMLIDRNMTKSDLQKAANLSWSSIARLNRGDNIGTDVLVRICEVLDCDLFNIMELERQKQ